MLIIAVIAGLVVLADQALKQYVISTMDLGERIVLIPGVLRLAYVQNTGMVFGSLANHAWVPMVFVPLVKIGLIFIIIRNWFPGKLCQIALALILGGAIGNYIDRLRHGFVVDMFEPIFVRFAVFNLADVFIVCGGILFIFAHVLAERQKKLEPQGQTIDDEDSELS